MMSAQQQQQQLAALNLGANPENDPDFNAETEARMLAAADIALRIHEARRSPLGLYKLLFTDEEGKPIVVKWFHEEWNQMVLKNRCCLIEASRETTKCRVGSQRVLTSDGRHAPIKELAAAGVASILSYVEKTGNLVKQQAYIKENGIASTRSIELYDGATQRLTDNEPILTDSGWKRADTIATGDYIRCLRKEGSSNRGARRLPHGIAYLLGLLIGDGSLTSGTGLSCADSEIITYTEALGRQLGFSLHKIPGDNADWSTAGLTKIIEPYGIRKKNSHTKRVPDVLFGASSKSVAEFLAGYWDADGTAIHEVAELSFTSCNRDLIDDVKYLCLKLERPAIGCIRDTSYNGFTSYKLVFHGRDALSLWYGIRQHTASKKSAAIDASWHARYGSTPWLGPNVSHWRYINKLENGDGFTGERVNVTQTTYGVPEGLIRKILYTHGISLHSIHAAWHDPPGDAPPIGLSGQQAAYREAIVHRIAKVCEYSLNKPAASEDLRAAANKNYFWNRVLSNKDGGRQKTYALCSPEHQTYVCEGAVTHNTSFILAACLWIIGRNRNIRVKLLTETEKNAKKRLAFLHEVIDKSVLYHMVFPKVRKDKNPKKSDTTTCLHLVRDVDSPEPTIEVCGVESAGTGGRADLIIMDDVVGESNTIKNPAKKPKIIQKVLNDWLGTLVAKGRVWCIFSPWASDDCNAYLKKNMTDWAYRKYTHGKPGNPYFSIFPERWPEEVLKNRRRWFGALVYARMYLCELISNTINTVKPEHLRTYSQQELTREKLLKAHGIISLDPASGRKLGQGKLDYVGVAILLYMDHTDMEDAVRISHHLPKFEIFVVEAFQIKISTIQQAMLAWQLVRQWTAQTVLVESQGMQNLAEWLDNQKSGNETLNTDIYPVPVGSQSKGDRLLSITPILDPVEGDPPWVYFHPQVVTDAPSPQVFRLTDNSEHEILHDLREQLLSFPLPPHDDIQDAVVQGIKWILFNLAPGADPNEGIDAEDMEGMSFVSI